jgi:hypothetical protein
MKKHILFALKVFTFFSLLGTSLNCMQEPNYTKVFSIEELPSEGESNFFTDDFTESLVCEVYNGKTKFGDIKKLVRGHNLSVLTDTIFEEIFGNKVIAGCILNFENLCQKDKERLCNLSEVFFYSCVFCWYMPISLILSRHFDENDALVLIVKKFLLIGLERLIFKFSYQKNDKDGCFRILLRAIIVMSNMSWNNDALSLINKSGDLKENILNRIKAEIEDALGVIFGVNPDQEINELYLRKNLCIARALSVYIDSAFLKTKIRLAAKRLSPLRHTWHSSGFYKTV